MARAGCRPFEKGKETKDKTKTTEKKKEEKKVRNIFKIRRKRDERGGGRKWKRERERERRSWKERKRENAAPLYAILSGLWKGMYVS